ncbi:hypothetical protein SCOCK_70182 [Actinacidiphila cocklensis]|uniref:Transposase n=1 Tax=Actinacidiphila cocklensis TaxID=887465 RepID=A0A9W4DXW8_9ACTN|nr:hypothetical protein SCOCK_70182 [Actinacidiphila cocklensis]
MTCKVVQQLAAHIADLAQLLTPREGNADGLSRWIVQVRAVGLPHLHSFARGLDRDAVIAALTLPYSNGPSKASIRRPSGSRARCTDGRTSPFFATASSPDSGTFRHHRKRDRAVDWTHPD